MKPQNLFPIVLALLAWTSLPAGADPAIPAYVAAAVADSGRPLDDKAQDVNRRPGEVLAFTGIKPGDKVVDLMPGRRPARCRCLQRRRILCWRR